MFGWTKFLKIARWVALGLLGVVALAAVLGFVIQALWNWLMPSIFGLPEITYWQAWGVVILAHVLLGGRGGESRETHHHHHDGFREEVRKRFRGEPDKPQGEGTAP